jgi:hypothetical protein
MQTKKFSKFKKVSAVSAAALMIASISSGLTVSAAENNIMPKQIYMTNYRSGPEQRQSRLEAQVAMAETMLKNIDTSVAVVPAAAPSFGAIIPVIGETKYDKLLGSPYCDNGVILTFNSSGNLMSGMGKIKAEEQRIMNEALAPYKGYIESVISAGTFTSVQSTDDAETKMKKQLNMNVLNTAKSQLAYNYTDNDLFYGDATGTTKTYQIASLAESTIGNDYVIKRTVISNSNEFYNFPRMQDGSGGYIDWSTVNHLNVEGNSNTSWWYTVSDGATLNNDQYWLAGMMIPNFLSNIAYDAYAGTSWKQYGSFETDQQPTTDPGTTTTPTDPGQTTPVGPGTTTGVPASDYYYNSSLNKGSENIYAISNGTYTFYYPNLDYAKAAIAAKPGFGITDIKTVTLDKNKPFFCFRSGTYSSAVKESAYPEATAYMEIADSGSGSGSGSSSTVKEDDYYYNSAYNTASNSVYQVTNGTYSFYYPNQQYANAAVNMMPGFYIKNVISVGTNSSYSSYYSYYNNGYSIYSPYFCFRTGNYYSSPSASPYPQDTYLMTGSSSTSGNYSYNNGNVYDNTGRIVGTASQRGYSNNATWFCTTTGYFYSGPQSNLSGYYVNGSQYGTGNYNISNGYVYDRNGNKIGSVTDRAYSSQYTWFCTDDGMFYPMPQVNRSGYYVNASILGNMGNGYTLNNGYVYDKSGNMIGTAQQRGYSSTMTWFCADDGMFYAYPQSNRSGYYAPQSMLGNANNGYTVVNGNVYDSKGQSVGSASQRGLSDGNQWFSTSTGLFYNTPQSGQSGYYVNSGTGNKTTTTTTTTKTTTTSTNTSTPEVITAGTNETNYDNTTSSTNGSITTIKMSNPILSGTRLAKARANKETLRLVMSSKTYWTIEGGDIKKARATDFSVVYGTHKNVPVNLRNAVLDGNVALYGFTVGKNIKWDLTATVRLKLNKKYANYEANVYRYDTATNQLIFVTKATAGDDGYISISNINHGGDYIMTLY